MPVDDLDYNDYYVPSNGHEEGIYRFVCDVTTSGTFDVYFAPQPANPEWLYQFNLGFMDDEGNYDTAKALDLTMRFHNSSGAVIQQFTDTHQNYALSNGGWSAYTLGQYFSPVGTASVSFVVSAHRYTYTWNYSTETYDRTEGWVPDASFQATGRLQLAGVNIDGLDRELLTEFTRTFDLYNSSELEMYSERAQPWYDLNDTGSYGYSTLNIVSGGADGTPYCLEYLATLDHDLWLSINKYMTKARGEAARLSAKVKVVGRSAGQARAILRVWNSNGNVLVSEFTGGTVSVNSSGFATVSVAASFSDNSQGYRLEPRIVVVPDDGGDPYFHAGEGFRVDSISLCGPNLPSDYFYPTGPHGWIGPSRGYSPAAYIPDQYYTVSDTDWFIQRYGPESDSNGHGWLVGDYRQYNSFSGPPYAGLVDVHDRPGFVLLGDPGTLTWTQPAHGVFQFFNWHPDFGNFDYIYFPEPGFEGMVTVDCSVEERATGIVVNFRIHFDCVATKPVTGPQVYCNGWGQVKSLEYRPNEDAPVVRSIAGDQYYSNQYDDGLLALPHPYSLEAGFGRIYVGGRTTNYYGGTPQTTWNDGAIVAVIDDGTVLDYQGWGAHDYPVIVSVTELNALLDSHYGTGYRGNWPVIWSMRIKDNYLYFTVGYITGSGDSTNGALLRQSLTSSGLKNGPAEWLTGHRGKRTDGGEIDGSGSDIYVIPMDIAVVEGENALLIADPEYRCIRKYNITTGVMTTVCGMPEVRDVYEGYQNRPPYHRDGPASQAVFRYPMSVDMKDGIVYIHDRTSLRRWDPSTNIVDTLATNLIRYGGSASTRNLFGYNEANFDYGSPPTFTPRYATASVTSYDYYWTYPSSLRVDRNSSAPDYAGYYGVGITVATPTPPFLLTSVRCVARTLSGTASFQMDVTFFDEDMTPLLSATNMTFPGNTSWQFIEGPTSQAFDLFGGIPPETRFMEMRVWQFGAPDSADTFFVDYLEALVSNFWFDPTLNPPASASMTAAGLSWADSSQGFAWAEDGYWPIDTDSECQRIRCDDYGTIWISNGWGVTRFDLADGEFKYFGRGDWWDQNSGAVDGALWDTCDALAIINHGSSGYTQDTSIYGGGSGPREVGTAAGADQRVRAKTTSSVRPGVTDAGAPSERGTSDGGGGSPRDKWSLHSFGPEYTGFYDLTVNGTTVDSAGNVYVLYGPRFGGDSWSGCMKYSPTNVPSVLWDDDDQYSQQIRSTYGQAVWRSYPRLAEIYSFGGGYDVWRPMAIHAANNGELYVMCKSQSTSATGIEGYFLTIWRMNKMTGLIEELVHFSRSPVSNWYPFLGRFANGDFMNRDYWGVALFHPGDGVSRFHASNWSSVDILQEALVFEGTYPQDGPLGYGRLYSLNGAQFDVVTDRWVWGEYGQRIRSVGTDGVVRTDWDMDGTAFGEAAGEGRFEYIGNGYIHGIGAYGGIVYPLYDCYTGAEVIAEANLTTRRQKWIIGSGHTFPYRQGGPARKAGLGEEWWHMAAGPGTIVKISGTGYNGDDPDVASVVQIARLGTAGDTFTEPELYPFPYGSNGTVQGAGGGSASRDPGSASHVSNRVRRGS